MALEAPGGGAEPTDGAPRPHGVPMMSPCCPHVPMMSPRPQQGSSALTTPAILLGERNREVRWVPIPDRGGCGSPSQTPPPQQSPLTLFSPYQQSDCPGQGVPQGAQEALHHVSQIHQRSFGSSAAHLRVCGEKWGSESCPHWELCLHGPPPTPSPELLRAAGRSDPTLGRAGGAAGALLTHLQSTREAPEEFSVGLGCSECSYMWVPQPH